MTKRSKEAVSLVRANYNFIKGQLGEAIIERLFETLGMYVCRFGCEHTVQKTQVLRKQGKIKTKAIKRISFQPDFIIVKEVNETEKDGQEFRVEVKYSGNGKHKFEDLFEYDYDVHFILLDKENFWAINRQDLDQLKDKRDTKSFSSSELTLLEDYDPFHFSDEQKRIIVAFKRFIQATFASISDQNDVVDRVQKDFEDVWEELAEDSIDIYEILYGI